MGVKDLSWMLGPSDHKICFNRLTEDYNFIGNMAVNTEVDYRGSRDLTETGDSLFAGQRRAYMDILREFERSHLVNDDAFLQFAKDNPSMDYHLQRIRTIVQQTIRDRGRSRERMFWNYRDLSVYDD